MATPVPPVPQESNKERETRERRARDDQYADMDRKMREAADRFKRSKENDTPGYKRGGKVKKMCRGGGIEQRGKTKGRFV